MSDNNNNPTKIDFIMDKIIRLEAEIYNKELLVLVLLDILEETINDDRET